MALFPSKEWCESLVDVLDGDPETARAGKGFSAAVAAAVLPEPNLPEGFAVWARVEDGRIAEMRVLEDLDEIDEIEPDYEARAPLEVWRQLLEKRLDPIDALVKGRVKLVGDLQPVIERAQYKHLFWRALSRVPTTFAD